MTELPEHSRPCNQHLQEGSTDEWDIRYCRTEDGRRTGKKRICRRKEVFRQTEVSEGVDQKAVSELMTVRSSTAVDCVGVCLFRYTLD